MQPLSLRHPDDSLCSILSTSEMCIYVCIHVCVYVHRCMCVCDSACMCAHECVHVEVSEQPWASCLGMSSFFCELGSLNGLELVNYAGGSLPAGSRDSPVSASSVLEL